MSSPLKQLKKNVDDLQAKLTQAKGAYKSALRNLETISDEIHERRRSSVIGPRERGVGAEGDGVIGEDLSAFKMESDGISSESMQHTVSRLHSRHHRCSVGSKIRLPFKNHCW